jgi:hypothetical protein
MTSHSRLLAVGVLLAGCVLQAAVPTLKELSPRGAQRGKTFALYLRGENLTQAAQVQSTLPAVFSRLTLSKDPATESNQASMTPNSSLPYMVTLKSDAPTGLYPIRIVSPDGISNVLLFSVGDLPEVDEAEAKAKSPKVTNDQAKEAQRVTVPVTINGTLEGPASDIDNYVFTAKAGQKLVFEVEARRAGSAIDPAIEIYDATGKELAKNDDAPGLGVDSRLTYTFAKAGDYRVTVHDSKYSQQGQNFYRLHIGRYDYADAIFPLGWRRGEHVDVALFGGNLEQPVKIAPDFSAKSAVIGVRVPGSPSLPLQFALSDQPEVLEVESGGPMALVEGTIVNGRIGKAAEVDNFTLAVTPGQSWVIDLAGASLGTSRLNALVTVNDEKGKKIGVGDDTDGNDLVLPFTVPKDVHQVTVKVEDLLRRGGPAYGYRLKATQAHPDFTVDIATPFLNVPAGGTAAINVDIQRRGYDGEITLELQGLPPGFSWAGGHVVSEAAEQSFNNENAGRRRARSVITVTADPDIKPVAAELTIVGEAVTREGVIRRTASGPGMVTLVRGNNQRPFTAPWLDMQLPMAVTAALPVKLASTVPLVRIAQGFEFPIEYRITRGAAMKGDVKAYQRINANVGNLRILKGPPGKNADNGIFLLNTNFATPVSTFDATVQADVEIDGKTETIFSPTVVVQIVPGYEVQLQQNNIEVTPGGKVNVSGRVRREPTFEGGAIRVQVEDLPDGVKCALVEVPAGQREFTLACEAAAGAKPGSFPVRIASTAPETGRTQKADYKIADLDGKLVISGTARASQ